MTMPSMFLGRDEPLYEYFVWTIDRSFTLFWDRATFGVLGAGVVLLPWGARSWSVCFGVIGLAVACSLYQRYVRFPRWLHGNGYRPSPPVRRNAPHDNF
jgi:hypothetical protein